MGALSSDGLGTNRRGPLSTVAASVLTLSVHSLSPDRGPSLTIRGCLVLLRHRLTMHGFAVLLCSVRVVLRVNVLHNCVTLGRDLTCLLPCALLTCGLHWLFWPLVGANCLM